MTTVLDPTGERKPSDWQRRQRPTEMKGLRVGLLDISKPRGDIFLDRMQSHLEALGMKVERFQKPTFARPAPLDLRHEIATKCDVVIEALAD